MSTLRTRWELAALSAFVMISAMSLSSAEVQAKEISGTITIENGDHYGWKMDIMIPSQIEARISSNVSVDVLVMDEENYSDYSDGRAFGYYAQFSELATSNATLNFTVLSGTVYIIVDNSEHPSLNGAAAPEGPAGVEYWLGSAMDLHAIPEQSNVWVIYLLIGVMAFALVLVIVLARIAMKTAKNWGKKKD